MTKGKQFSTKTPAGLIEVVGIVDAVLNGEHSKLEIPLVSDGTRSDTAEDALNVAQNLIKEDWVRQARVKWLDIGLSAWEKWAENPTLHSHFDLTYHKVEEFGLSSFMVYVKTSHVGESRNVLMDRMLDMLFRLATSGKSKVAGDARVSLRVMIDRRSHCLRAGDPHCDEVLRQMLYLKYRIS